MRILLATRSADKVREIRQILAARFDPGALLTPDDCGIRQDPEEDDTEIFDSFVENALAKAQYFAERAGIPAIADDSGIAVDALDGAPGVRSKRFAAAHGIRGRALDHANNELLLQKLRDVPPQRRGARYLCAAAVWTPAAAAAFLGACSGRIADAPRGTGGFGYDPLFVVPDLGLTFAQLPPREKHRRSHRARAFHALAAHLHDLPPGLDLTRRLR